MNIIFIGESYLGGMAGSKRIQNIINSLKRMDNVLIHNLILLPKEDTQTIKEDGKKDDVHYRIFHYSIRNPFNLIRLYFSSYKYLSSSKSDDGETILYCYDTPTLLNFPLLLLARMKKIKVVVDIVEDYNLLNKSNLSIKQKVKLRVYSFLEKKMASYANGVLVISSYLEQHVRGKIQKSTPIFHLPITVNLELFPHHSQISTSKNPLKIFYGGSFGEKDGLLYLISAFNEVASKFDVELILTGKPPKNGMQPIMDQIQNSPFKSKIHFLGYLDDSEYYRVMNSSDVFCMTRINSSYANAGFPFKLGEMLATGKPVIATKVGDVPKYLNNQQNAILITPERIEDISEAITFIINNPDRANQIGNNGRSVVLQNFDSDKVCQSLHNFLQHHLK